MAQRAGRLTCPRCGANNFDTVSVCWKCSAPLGAAGAGNVGSPPAPPANLSPVGYGGVAPPVERGYAPPAYAPAPSDGDPAVAQRAAIALALVIPFVGLPVGWVFMMIEDKRKQAIGRVCVIWSTIALFFHLLLMFALAASTGPLIQSLMPLLDKTLKERAGGGGGGGGEKALNSGE